MDDFELTAWMHAVLDGEATPEQAQALHALLARDSAARAEFETWRTTFGGLSALPPLAPPPGLVDAVVARLAQASTPASQTRVENVQLSSRPSVLASRPADSSGWSERLKSLIGQAGRFITSQEKASMNINRKVLAGGAFAVVALGVVVVLAGYPPKSDSTLGTVVPAERYRGPQAGAEAVKLGQGESAVPATQSAPVSSTEAARAERAMSNTSAERAVSNTSAERAMSNTSAERAVSNTSAERAMSNTSAERAMSNTSAERAVSNTSAERAMSNTSAERAVSKISADKAAASLSADKAAQAAAADSRQR